MAQDVGGKATLRSISSAGRQPSEWEEIYRLARTELVKRKQPVYLTGDPAHSVYLLKQGRVKITNCDRGGREVTFTILRPGDVFGEIEAIDGTTRETSAEALDDVMLGVISREDFLRHLHEHPETTLELTRRIGARLLALQSRVEDLVFRDVPSRLAHLLEELGEPDEQPSGSGHPIRAKLTHQELANLIGCNRETVSAVLGQFRQQGLIRLNRRSITILNRARLNKDRVASLAG